MSLTSATVVSQPAPLRASLPSAKGAVEIVVVVGRSDSGPHSYPPWRHSMAEAFGLPTPREMLLLHQIHGNGIVSQSEAAADSQAEGDGLWTQETQSHSVLTVQTADCAPLVLSDARRPFLAVLHSGWRGTLAGILNRAVELAVASGSLPGDLHLWIGPHIRKDSYQVSLDLANRFRERFGPQVAEERQLSIVHCLRVSARESGIPEAQVMDCGEGTYATPRPSFRRDGRTGVSLYTGARFISHPEAPAR